MPRRAPSNRALPLLTAVFVALLAIRLWPHSPLPPPLRRPTSVWLTGTLLEARGRHLTIRRPAAGAETVTLAPNAVVQWAGPGHQDLPQSQLLPGSALAARVVPSPHGPQATVIRLADAEIRAVVIRWTPGSLVVSVAGTPVPVALQVGPNTAWHLPGGDPGLLRATDPVRVAILPSASGGWQAADVWVSAPPS
jgi:hypothetical protein